MGSNFGCSINYNSQVKLFNHVDQKHQSLILINNLFSSSLVGKGTSDALKIKKLSYRIGLMVVLLSGLVIWTYYRAAMNAFLAARITKLPINSMMDIYNKDYKLQMWENGVLESFLNSTPTNSIYNMVYRKAINSGEDMYMKVSYIYFSISFTPRKTKKSQKS
jgi:hypothetical protein